MSILDAKMHDGGTVRSYLKDLLLNLWLQGSDFDSKRPFGDGAWQFDVYAALIAANLIPGKLDEDGCVDSVNEAAADRCITEAIKELFAEPSNLKLQRPSTKPKTLEEAFGRLEAVIKHLRAGQLAHAKFDFNCINYDPQAPTGCGTAGCAYGEFPVIFPEDFDFVNPTKYRNLIDGDLAAVGDILNKTTHATRMGESIPEYLGISRHATSVLFDTGTNLAAREGVAKLTRLCGIAPLHAKATRYEVADNMQTFLDWAKAHCATLEDLASL